MKLKSFNTLTVKSAMFLLIYKNMIAIFCNDYVSQFRELLN